mmetsp:Transcript_8748/g.25160  ORF Transcript_8748/g.25160 Transcript_8748/m.25160 type:complete len:205 (-) Transcript_8748:1675-2289(-)
MASDSASALALDSMRIALAAASAASIIRLLSALALVCKASALANALMLRTSAAVRSFVVEMRELPSRLAISFSIWAVVRACLEIWSANSVSMILNDSMRMLAMSTPYRDMKSSCSLSRNSSWAFSKKAVVVLPPCSSSSSTPGAGITLSPPVSPPALTCFDCAISLSAVDRMMLVNVATAVSRTKSSSSSVSILLMHFSGSSME